MIPKLGVRTRILLVTIGLVLVVGGPVGGLVEWRQRTQLQSLVEEDLRQDAMAVRAHLDSLHPANMDASVDRMAKAMEVRLTVIDIDGTVLADSQLDGDALTDVENHGARPEVVEAMAKGIGRSMRWSTTVDNQMQYVAISTTIEGRPTFVRSAAPLTRINSTITQLRLTLLLGAGLAMVLALLTGSLVAAWVGNLLRNLVEGAQELAMGETQNMPHGASVETLGRQLQGAVRDLAGERDQLQAVLGAVGDGVIAVDDHLHITLLNTQAKQLLGRSARVGVSLEEAGAALMMDAAHAAVLGEVATEEVRWPGPPRRTLEVTAARFQYQEGCVLVVHDLTALRKLERVRSDFVANVSHELRTPISIIAATTETLMAGAIDDAQAREHFVEATHRHATRLGALVNDLLSLSRIEAGQMPMDPAQLDVSAMVHHITNNISQDPSRVHINVPSGLELYADPQGLEHALGNLIDNALKYGPKTIPIEVRAFREVNRTVIEVADEGPGIPKEHRSRVFERFYRVDAGRSRAVGGTGLGLSIVRHLVESMGGRVSVQANDPQGSVFRLELPSRPDRPNKSKIGGSRPAPSDNPVGTSQPSEL